MKKVSLFRFSPINHRMIGLCFIYLLSASYQLLFGQCISDIDVLSYSYCDDQGTVDINDDVFYGLVEVEFSGPIPGSGTLDLWEDPTGPIIASIQASSISGNSVQIEDVPLKATLNPEPIELTATFSSGGCTLYKNTGHLSRQVCSVCPCVANTCGQSYPSCWPSETTTTTCEQSIAYAPDPLAPELTPIRYVNVVLHIFQKEDPNNLDQFVVHPTDPGNFTEAHLPLIDSWFNGPNGVNGFLGNLCEPDEPSPWIKDSRIRFLNTGTVGHDIFFHPDNKGWGVGFGTCGNSSASAYWFGSNTGIRKYVNNPPANHPHVDALLSPETKNSFHVFITGGTWEPQGAGDPAIPDEDDCYWPCGGGMTSDMNCVNGGISPNPIQAIFGTYNIWQSQGVPGVPCATGYPTALGDEGLGKMMTGEFMHVLGVDHISPLQAHKTHANGDDGCDDTPLDSEVNLLGCKGGLARCALSECQLGKIHYLFAHSKPAFERFPDGNGNFVIGGSCDIVDPDIIIKDGDDIVWDNMQSIRSNVLVESGGKLTISCDLGMPENGRITVEPNGYLVVDGARIYPNCADTFWEGIIVQGSGNGFPQDYDWASDLYYVGRCQIKSGSLIEGAVVGARAQEIWPEGRTGGVIRATGASFLNCKRHAVLIRDFDNIKLYPSSQYGQATGNRSYFSKCEFTVDGSLSSGLDDMHSLVRLDDVDGIRFTGCKLTNEFPEVQAFSDERRYGIHAKNSSFRFAGTCAQNPPQFPCNQYDNAHVEGFFQGFHVENIAGAHTVSVSNTTFENNHFGITAFKVPNAYIVDNEFLVGSNLPAKTNPSSDIAHRGLELYACTGFKVEENEFSPYNDFVSTPKVGIKVSSAGPDANEIYKNSFEDLFAGNIANGNNLNKSTPEVGLRYLCNENTGNTFDFAVPDPGYGGIATIQGIPNADNADVAAAGNTFTPDPGGGDPEMHFLNVMANIDYFYAANQPNEEPFNITPLKVIKNLATQVNQCPSKVPGLGEYGELTPTEKELYEQEATGGSDASIKSHAADMLVRHYMVDTTEQNLDSVRIWLTEKDGLFAHFTIVETWLQQKDAGEAQRALDGIPPSLLLNEDDSTEYQLFSDLKNIQIAALQNDWDEERTYANYGDDLDGIAGKGNFHASIQARSLIAFANGEEWTPEIILPDFNDSERAGKIEALNYAPKVYPNPSHGEVNLEFATPGALVLEVSIYNTAGSLVKQIAESEYSDGNFSANWKVDTDTPSGVYIVVFRTNYGTFQEKLVVNK